MKTADEMVALIGAEFGANGARDAARLLAWVRLNGLLNGWPTQEQCLDDFAALLDAIAGITELPADVASRLETRTELQELVTPRH
mgnify:FL=1